jgi:hypothetical protein
MRPNFAETCIPNVESRSFQVRQLAISIHMERHFPKLAQQRKRLVNHILPLRLFWTGFITHSAWRSVQCRMSEQSQRKRLCVMMACAQRHRAAIEIAGRVSKASFTLETVIVT